jgi:hypothetical protein
MLTNKQKRDLISLRSHPLVIVGLAALLFVVIILGECL